MSDFNIKFLGSRRRKTFESSQNHPVIEQSVLQDNVQHQSLPAPDSFLKRHECQDGSKFIGIYLSWKDQCEANGT